MNKKFIKLSGLVLAVLMLFSCAQAAGGDDTADSGNKNVSGNTSEASFPYAKYRYFNNNGSSDGSSGVYFDADLRRNSEQFSIRVAGNEVYIKDNVNGMGEHKFVWSTVGKDLYLSGYITNSNNNYKKNTDSTDIFLVGRPNRTSNYNEEAKVLKLDFVSYDDNSSGDNGGGTGDSGSAVTADSIVGTWTYTGSLGGANITSTLVFNSNGTVNYSSTDSQKAPSWTASFTVSNSKLKFSGSYKMSGSASSETSFDNEEHELSISNGKLYISNLSGTISTSLHYGTNNIDSNNKLVLTKSN